MQCSDEEADEIVVGLGDEIPNACTKWTWISDVGCESMQ